MASSEAEGPKSLSLQELLDRNWVTLSQYVDLLGVTYQTGLRHIREGKLRAVKVGKVYRIYEDELRRVLTEGTGSNPRTK